MIDIENYARKQIVTLSPYSSARDEYTGNATILLDANENSFGSVLSSELRGYPDPGQLALKAAFSSLYNVGIEQIFLGNGSDEVIDLLIRVFCEPNCDEIIICPPTYGMYAVCAAINSTKVREVALTPQFQPDLDAILNVASSATKILFLCSPNNPTGNLVDRSLIEGILSEFKGIVAIDEAYIDFCPDMSALDLRAEYPNLVLIRTLSKAWGLAGIRLGVALSSIPLVKLLNKVKPPYNISTTTQSFALQALKGELTKNTLVAQVIAERERLIKELVPLSLVERIFPSAANFLLVQFTSSRLVWEALKEAGVIVRDRSSTSGCQNCLRITVGTAEQNTRLIEVISELKL